VNRIALQQCSYGVYIISAREGDKLNGQVANTVCQVTSEPAMVSVCINKQNLTYEMISRGRAFTVSILDEGTPLQLIGVFGFKSGRDSEKFEGINYRLGQTGGPHRARSRDQLLGV
jgi:ferric-chelate reductase [NAD(P)H]